MTDKEFLSWVADRLVHVYGESESVDFVHKLRKISQRTWVGLTEKDICEAAVKSQEGISPRDDTLRFAIAIEAKLKENNT